jgi:hypothetical protein
MLIWPVIVIKMNYMVDKTDNKLIRRNPKLGKKKLTVTVVQSLVPSACRLSSLSQVW